MLHLHCAPPRFARRRARTGRHAPLGSPDRTRTSPTSRPPCPVLVCLAGRDEEARVLLPLPRGHGHRDILVPDSSHNLDFSFRAFFVARMSASVWLLYLPRWRKYHIAASVAPPAVAAGLRGSAADDTSDDGGDEGGGDGGDDGDPAAALPPPPTIRSPSSLHSLPDVS